jgi:hypothetical protein
MKAKLITDTELPGAISIEAETPEEALILRMFCNDKRGIEISGWGGTITQDIVSMTISHRKDK